MMWDIFLGGYSNKEWRKEFKKLIGKELTVFDPLIDNYQTLDKQEQINQTAKEWTYIYDRCDLILFYWNSDWKGASSLIDLGHAVGRGEQVIVCCDGDVKGKEAIQMYCEFHGVLFTENLDDLVTTVEEYFGEIEICRAEKLA